MSNSLCRTFNAIALETWHTLRTCKEISFKFNEETITERILFRLKVCHSSQVTVYAFNKREEAMSGADWEWWFVNGTTKGLGFRVQAKIIDLNTDTYNYLHKEGQTVKLIQQAAVTPKKIPIYCLYTYSKEVPNEAYGCSLIDAYEVHNINPQNNISLLNRLLKPWEYLVCNSSGADSDLKTIDSFVQRHFPRAVFTMLDIDLDPPAQISDIPESQRSMITDQLPSYVKEILSGSNSVQSPDEDLKSVVIVNLNKGE